MPCPRVNRRSPSKRLSGFRLETELDRTEKREFVATLAGVAPEDLLPLVADQRGAAAGS